MLVASKTYIFSEIQAQDRNKTYSTENIEEYNFRKDIKEITKVSQLIISYKNK